MRILFLSDNFPPEVNAPATRTFEHCKEWVRLGAQVTVITGFPNFPQGKVFAGYKNSWKKRENVEGIDVIRVWTFIAPNKGMIKRSLDFLSFACMAFVFGLFQKADVVIGTSPQFFTALAARWIGFLKSIPWVMEVRDLWPDSIVAVGALKESSLVYRFLHRVEKKLYASASLIVVVTDSFKKAIQDLGISQDKIIVVKNGVDTSFFIPQAKNSALMDKLNLNGQFIIGYIGTHGMSHALDFVLDCVQEIPEDIHLIMQGAGAEKQNLLKKAKELDIKNVTFLPSVSKSEIPKYISIVDVALVNLKQSKTFRTVIPSKIFENAAMHKPILLGVEGESKRMIEKYNAGVTFIPENKNSFLHAISKIRNSDDYRTYQQGCAKLAQDFERNILAKQMLNEIEKIVRNA